MKRNIAVIGLVLLLVGIAVYQNGRHAESAAASPKETAAKPNFMAPELKLAALDGTTLQIGGARDKPLFVNFWASWCGPCETEAPYLKKLSEKYKDQMDFYAVNVTAEDKLPMVQDFVKQYGWTMPILLDKEGAAANLYRIRGIPTTFLIDEQGMVKDAFNFLSPEELEQRIQGMLK